jgi:hypothetical protein
MKAVIWIAVIICVFLGIYKLWEYWDTMDKQRALELQRASQVFNGDRLPGMASYQLEGALAEAKTAGPAGVKNFIQKYRKSIQDPRLGWIELEYALSIATQDAVEAKKIYLSVKERIPPDSPLYKKIKEMEKAFE